MFVAGEFLLIALMQIYCEPVGKRIWKIDQRLAKLQQKMAKFFFILTVYIWCAPAVSAMLMIFRMC